MSQSQSYKESPSQTAGPYVHIGCVPNFVGISSVYPQDLGAVMVGNETKGERIAVEGRIFDGDNALVKDALIEIWQADADGIYGGSTVDGFTGWGRQPTDLKTGAFRFETIKPGRVPYADGRLQAPHINLWIVARGINLGLSTRIYFSDESAANAEDPALLLLNDDTRAATLIARRNGESYTFDIHLQGENETVFFDV